ncbi:MAG: hypothetical protein GXO26_08150 [Crenarchaeota archaeon]|nr:hypothetical protein [Thermoproteota archaeon]
MMRSIAGLLDSEKIDSSTVRPVSDLFERIVEKLENEKVLRTRRAIVKICYNDYDFNNFEIDYSPINIEKLVTDMGKSIHSIGMFLLDYDLYMMMYSIDLLKILNTNFEIWSSYVLMSIDEACRMMLDIVEKYENIRTIHAGTGTAVRPCMRLVSIYRTVRDLEYEIEKSTGKKLLNIEKKLENIDIVEMRNSMIIVRAENPREYFEKFYMKILS